MRPADELPTPACRLGYTSTQALGILGADRLRRFMSTHTTVKCNGATGCGPHGNVITAVELKGFLDGERR